MSQLVIPENGHDDGDDNVKIDNKERDDQALAIAIEPITEPTENGLDKGIDSR
jgi:hypothetical protein